MNNEIKKFRNLLLTDEKFQQKLQAASEAYTGEQTEEAVFNEVLTPLAAQYGISATYDEFHEFITSEQEMADEELMQIAGGSKGASGAACWGIGIGIGASADDDGGPQNCCIGIGAGSTGACMGKGTGVGLGL